MADEEEKTEEPTGKRQQDARNDGNVPKSQEVNTFFSLLISFVLVYVLANYTFDGFTRIYVHYIGFFKEELTMTSAMSHFITLLKETTLILLPYMGVLMFVGLATNIAQFGLLFTTKPIQFKFNKLNPINGLKNLISMQKIVKGLMDTARVFLVFTIGFFVYIGIIKELPTVALFDLYNQIKWFSEKALLLISSLLFVFFIIAAIDLIYTRWKHNKSLKMTKQEVKDEMKQMEGDPTIKRKIRQIMFQKAFSRMMSNIPKADVVVTNPTHYAIALAYDEKKHVAPVVLAKGADLIALQIKKIAREHDIQIVENAPLARELYKICDVDKPVPQNMWQAVAEVLAFVRRSAAKARG